MRHYGVDKFLTGLMHLPVHASLFFGSRPIVDVKLRPLIDRGGNFHARNVQHGLAEPRTSRPGSGGRAAQSLYEESDRLRRQNEGLRKRLEARDLEVQVLEALIESVQDACLYVTNREIVARVNMSFIQSFGTSRQRCIGQTITSLFGDKEEDGYTALSRRALKGETVITERTSTVRGKKVIDRIQIKPHKLVDGVIRGCLIQISDVTLLRRREHQLAKMRPMLEASGHHSAEAPTANAVPNDQPVAAIEGPERRASTTSFLRKILTSMFKRR